MTKFLSKAAIFAAADVQTREVDVPEWGGKVLVRGMTGAARDRFEQLMLNSKSKTIENYRAKLALVSIVDEDGEPLFVETDLELLAGKSASALSRVAEAAGSLSKLSQADVDDALKN